MLWSIKNKSQAIILFFTMYNLVCILWWPAASNECHFGYHCQRQASRLLSSTGGIRNKLFSPLFYWFYKNPSTAALANPFCSSSQGWGMFVHQNHATGGGNGASWWGCLWAVCFASKKHSEQEFFVPAKTDLAVKLLTCYLFFKRFYSHNI